MTMQSCTFKNYHTGLGKVEFMENLAGQTRVYLACLVSVVLSGCSYHRPSAVLRPPHEGHESVQQKVRVRIKPLRDFECSHYFDNRLVTRGIQPIQLYLENDSEQYYVLNAQTISLPIMGKRDVGSVLYKNIFGRSFVWGLGTVAFFWQMFLPIFVVDLLFCLQANKNIRSDIESVCINPKEKVVIKPHSRVHKVLFIPVEDYHHHLTLTLQEEKSEKELVFKF